MDKNGLKRLPDSGIGNAALATELKKCCQLWRVAPDDPDDAPGRFLAQAELKSGPHGATSGTFTLTLPHGLEASDARAVLEDATLNVAIETAPLQPSPAA